MATLVSRKRKDSVNVERVTSPINRVWTALAKPSENTKLTAVGSASSRTTRSGTKVRPPPSSLKETRKLIFHLSNFLDCMVSLTDFSVTQIWNAQENSVGAFGNLANVDSVTSCSVVSNDATTPDVEVSIF